MHPLYSVIEEMESTHSGLGKAMAFSIIAVKAKQCLLFVSPSGCGKSVISDTMAKIHPEAFPLLSVTKARLTAYKDAFSNFQGVVIMDDMSAAGSMYERKETLVAFSVMCYSHSIEKHTFNSDFQINNFQGSTMMNIQPVLLAEVYQYPEWEGLIQEKTLRYYHLYRPTSPTSGKPNLKVDWGIKLEEVHKPRHDYKLYSSLEKIAIIQWSDARAMEHLDNLLRAVAALDNRAEVIGSDLILLYKLIKPLSLERHIFQKSGFETGRYMDTNLCAVLVEFASWKDVNIDRIARDYKISPSTVYRLLSNIQEWFVQDKVKARRLMPKPALMKILKEAGVER